MLLWDEFRKQGKRDMLRAEKLFKLNESGQFNGEDYGAAAYSAQQALEKYVKAYLFKFDLVRGDPKDLGHLPIGGIFTKIIQELDGLETKQQHNKQFLPYIENAKNALKEIKKIIHIINNRDDPTEKIYFWKYSLGVEVDIKKGSPLDAYTWKVAEKVSEFSPSYHEYLEHVIKPKIEATNSPELKAYYEDYLNNLDKVSQHKPITWTESTKSLEKSSTTASILNLPTVVKIVAISRFLQVLIKAYPHEDIGRYPTEIDGMNSIELYKQHKDKLLVFINEIKSACNEIELALSE